MGSGRDKAEGKKDRGKGKVKETGGKAVGNESLEAEGKTDQAKGRGKEGLGKVKEAGRKAKERVKDAFD